MKQHCDIFQFFSVFLFFPFCIAIRSLLRLVSCKFADCCSSNNCMCVCVCVCVHVFIIRMYMFIQFLFKSSTCQQSVILLKRLNKFFTVTGVCCYCYQFLLQSLQNAVVVIVAIVGCYRQKL